MTYFKKGLGVAAVVLATAGAADAATYTYVGSWDVYNDATEVWQQPPTGPLAYTGQEAAAKLFGGTATKYVISTNGANVSDINFMSWYDVIGFGKSLFSQSYNNKYLGQFYGPTYGYSFDGTGSASALIIDNLYGQGAVNFAFAVAAVPVPAAGWLMVMAIGGLAAMRRRKSGELA